MDDPKEVNRIIDALPEEHRDHLRTLISNLVLSFDPKHNKQTLMLFKDEENGSVAIATANMNEYEATELLVHMAQVVEHKATSDAPPKEMFN